MKEPGAQADVVDFTLRQQHLIPRIEVNFWRRH
jgi:hypothetical protein